MFTQQELLDMIATEAAEPAENELNEAQAVQCLGCGRIYNEPPLVHYEDGHGGRLLVICRCGCDLFAAVDAQGGDEPFRGHVMSNGRNCLSHWLPRLEAAGLPVPRTVIVKTELELSEVLDDGGPPEFTSFLTLLRTAGDHVGWPAFLRTGHTSGKHEWNRTCYVPSADKLGWHVYALVEFSNCVNQPLGLPTNVWAVRELLPTKPVFTAPAYGNMPICREFRVFVDGGEVKCIHPYWPEEVLRRGFPYDSGDDWDDQGGNWDDLANHVVPSDFDEKYAALCDLKEEDEPTIRWLAGQAGAALGGEWSVDVLDTERGWFITDVAEAHRSFHWEGCEAADAAGGDDE